MDIIYNPENVKVIVPRNFDLKNEILRVLASGSFNPIHEGHNYYLYYASTFGDIRARQWGSDKESELHVIVSSDYTITEIKKVDLHVNPKTGKISNEENRKKTIEELSYVSKVHVGVGNGDHYALVREINPHIIALGWDFFKQNPKKDTLEHGLNMNNLFPELISINHDGDAGHSSSNIRAISRKLLPIIEERRE
jgi:cytidyltransferase-like protein